MGLRLSKPVTTHSDWNFGSGFFPCAIAQKAFRRKRRSALHTLASVKRLHEDGQLNKAIQAAEELYREECAASTDILYLLLQGCINNKDLTSGRRVHQLITDCGFVKNPFLVQAINVYQAMLMLDVIPDQHIFVNALKACTKAESLAKGRLIQYQIVDVERLSTILKQSRRLKDAFEEEGVESDSVTFVSMLQVSSSLTSLVLGMLIHTCINLTVEKWPQKAMMTWNTMFTDSNLGEKNEDLPSDSIHGLLAASGTCFTKLLKACSSLNALDLGRCVHCNVLEVLLKLDAHIGNALIDIMMKEGVAPVEITYVCLLTACSRAGNWKEGCRFFESMINKHALSPTPDHYYCMVDLFGRSGKLTEADDILQTIPLWCPGVVGQRTFISHCRRHRNEELGHQWMAS
ncbi:hypothetical protein GOP47_0008082 [Adiantum capillus-veneris]|uniref:Pentatricopeptide repeat-containing protein n=1 Tax=Adiantum capillus-veneris TaxID=13818 RepID=A0A9D4UZ04_ADICA|nr:hypothetical protein GOP47_0008082 [Adiantum capillus-veneris]